MNTPQVCSSCLRSWVLRTQKWRSPLLRIQSCHGCPLKARSRLGNSPVCFTCSHRFLPMFVSLSFPLAFRVGPRNKRKAIQLTSSWSRLPCWVPEEYNTAPKQCVIAYHNSETDREYICELIFKNLLDRKYKCFWSTAGQHTYVKSEYWAMLIDSLDQGVCFL